MTTRLLSKAVRALTFLAIPYGHLCAQELDWDSVTMTTTIRNGTDQTFTVDDNGNYVSSAPLKSRGQISERELSTLDSPLSFANTPDAIVYQYWPSAGRGEACSSGDPSTTQDLVNDLNDLRSRYGCTPAPIWTTHAESFVLTSVDGLFITRPGSSCTERSVTYEFDLSSRRLSVFGCTIPPGTSGPAPLTMIDNTVQVTPRAAAQIASQMESMVSACPLDSCGYDAPTERIAISAGSGTPPITYSGNFYSGCPNSPVDPPYVAQKDLTALQSLLDQLIAAACGPSSGSIAVGTCVAR